MTVNFHPISLPRITELFHMENGRLIRDVVFKVNTDDPDVTDQECCRVDGVKIYTPRIIYTLINNKTPKGEVVVDDDGVLTDVTNAHFRAIVANRGNGGVRKLISGLYSGRYVSKKGKRSSKAFKDRDVALKWVRSNTKREWRYYLRKHNLFSIIG